MKPFQLPAQFSNLRYTVDGGLSVGFRSQEIPNEEKLLISEYYSQFGILLFRPNQQQYTEEEIPQEDIELGVTKTSSQRLRGVLYRYWEHKGKPGDSEVFYRHEMEKIINAYKQKLPR